MKTIFDEQIVEQLLARVDKLGDECTAKWGKMDVYQMVKHCNLSEAMFQGKKRYDRLLVGRLFGSLVLRGILKDDKPMKKNQPTHPTFKIKGSGDLAQEKEIWKKALKGYLNSTNLQFVHPFFGNMTHQQIGYYVYKHTDHHLRQFGV